MYSLRESHGSISNNSLRSTQLRHRVPSYRSLGSVQTWKPYRILGLEEEPSESTYSQSVRSASLTTTMTTTTRTLGDHMHAVVENLTLYFSLVPHLPTRLIDRHLQLARPADTFRAFHGLELKFSRCLLALSDTFWAMQAQLKEESVSVRKIFRATEYRIRKYLTRYLTGWKTSLLARSSLKHYRMLSQLRRALQKELASVKEIMDAVGPSSKELLLQVDVDIVEIWMINLDAPEAGRPGVEEWKAFGSPADGPAKKLVKLRRSAYGEGASAAAAAAAARVKNGWRLSRMSGMKGIFEHGRGTPSRSTGRFNEDGMEA